MVHMTCNGSVVGSNPSKAPVVSWSKKLYPLCLVLVGSRNGSIPDFIHYIAFSVLILEKEPVFSLMNVQC